MNSTASNDSTATADNDNAPLQTILEALRGLQFGSVTLIVQDGRIVQVERIEKKRLARAGRKEPAHL